MGKRIEGFAWGGGAFRALLLTAIIVLLGCLHPAPALATDVGALCNWSENVDDIPKVTVYTAPRTLTAAEIPSEGDEWDLGYGNVTDAWYAGPHRPVTDPNHAVWFCFRLHDTFGYLGGAMDFTWASQCIDPYKQTPGCATDSNTGDGSMCCCYAKANT